MQLPSPGNRELYSLQLGPLWFAQRQHRRCHRTGNYLRRSPLGHERSRTNQVGFRSPNLRRGNCVEASVAFQVCPRRIGFEPKYKGVELIVESDLAAREPAVGVDLSVGRIEDDDGPSPWVEGEIAIPMPPRITSMNTDVEAGPTQRDWRGWRDCRRFAGKIGPPRVVSPKIAIIPAIATREESMDALRWVVWPKAMTDDPQSEVAG
jgi:hypothetical protein